MPSKTVYNWHTILQFYITNSLSGTQPLSQTDWEALLACDSPPILNVDPTTAAQDEEVRRKFEKIVKQRIRPDQVAALEETDNGSVVWNLREGYILPSVKNENSPSEVFAVLGERGNMPGEGDEEEYGDDAGDNWRYEAGQARSRLLSSEVVVAQGLRGVESYSAPPSYGLRAPTDGMLRADALRTSSPASPDMFVDSGYQEPALSERSPSGPFTGPHYSGRGSPRHNGAADPSTETSFRHRDSNRGSPRQTTEPRSLIAPSSRQSNLFSHRNRRTPVSQDKSTDSRPPSGRRPNNNKSSSPRPDQAGAQSFRSNAETNRIISTLHAHLSSLPTTMALSQTIAAQEAEISILRQQLGQKDRQIEMLARGGRRFGRMMTELMRAVPVEVGRRMEKARQESDNEEEEENIGESPED